MTLGSPFFGFFSYFPEKKSNDSWGFLVLLGFFWFVVGLLFFFFLPAKEKQINILRIHGPVVSSVRTNYSTAAHF